MKKSRCLDRKNHFLNDEESNKSLSSKGNRLKSNLNYKEKIKENKKGTSLGYEREDNEKKLIYLNKRRKSSD